MKAFLLSAAILSTIASPALAGKKVQIISVTAASNYTQDFYDSYNLLYDVHSYIEDNILRDRVWDVLYEVKDRDCFTAKSLKKKRGCVSLLHSVEDEVEDYVTDLLEDS